MTHRKGAIWTERLLLGLILVSLAATLNLLLAIHRQAPADKQASTEEVAAPPLAESHERSPAPASEPAAPEGTVVEEKSAPRPPEPAIEDPTKKALASLAAATEKETKAAEESDRRARALEQGYRSAVAESDRWKRREMLVRQQIAGITAQAEKLEREADEVAAERDVLERELDATKAALAKASTRAGFAVLPYKGPNGTWRRPIVVECTASGAKIQPRGPSFTGMELSPRIHPRSSEFVKAIARELLHIRSADTPDGTPAVPYIVFLIRPDGIGAYYLARTSLEPLGIAFGYELVEQKLAVNIPDYDDLTTWDGTMPLDMPLETAPRSSSNRLARADQQERPTRSELAGSMQGDQNATVGSLAGAGSLAQQLGQGGQGSRDAGPEDFVWPGRARGATRDGERTSIPLPAGAPGSEAAMGNPASQPGGRGAGGNGLDGGAGALNPLPGPQLANVEDLGSAGGSGANDTAGTGANAGGSGAKDAAGTGPTADKNASPSAGSAAGGPGSANRPAGFGSGMTGNAVNAEDIGTADGGGAGAGAGVGVSPGAGASVSPGAGAAAGTSSGPRAGTGTSPGADPGDQPFSGGGPGTGMRGGGQRVPDARSAGTDNGFPLPNFEPATDQAGGSVSTGPAGMPSGGGRAGGQQQRQQTGQAPSFAEGGDQTPATGPAQTGAGSSKGVGADPAGGGGQATGFDWIQAAKDRTPSGGAGAPESDPGLATPPAGDQSAAQGTAASAGNLAPGRALNQSSLPAGGQPGQQPGAYPSGTYSQEDVDRAKALSGLSSLVSPSLAQKLVGATSSSGSTSETPSSASSNNSGSANQSGGMQLGGTTQSSMSSSASSSPAFGQFTLPNSSASSDSNKELTAPPRKKEDAPMGAIDARFEIVVVCRKDEVLLHPGAYRLTSDVLRSRTEGPDCMLAREIRAMVRNRAIVDPLIHQKPAIRFLVESQGADTFALARRQLLFSLPDWPVSLQVAGSQDPGILSRNRW